MDVISELIEFLSIQEQTQTVAERRILIRRTGVSNLENKLRLEGSASQFCDELLSILTGEGQSTLPKFLRKLSQLDDDFGLDFKEKIEVFYNQITAIPYESWRHLNKPFPKVFVSHHVNNPNQKRFLKRLCKVLKQQGYEVLVDKNGITRNDSWKSRLLRDLGICNAAILLLNKESLLEGSLYTEAVLLRWRQWSETNFMLIPICLGEDITIELGTEIWQQLEFSETEIVNDLSEENILDTIKQNLFPLKKSILGQSIVERRENALAKCFEETDEEYLKNALANLSKHYVYNKEQFLLTQLLAKVLFMAGPNAFEDLIKHVAKGIEFTLLKSVLEFITPSWVDLRIAGIISKVKHKKSTGRQLYLNGSLPDTAKMYVRQACHAHDLHLEWLVIEFTGNTGGLLEGILDEIRTELKDKLCLDPTYPSTDIDDLINETLSDIETVYGPVFVIFSPSLAEDGELIARVKATYPLLVIVNLTKTIEFTLHTKSNHLLIPPLDSTLEQQALKNYWKNQRLLKMYLKKEAKFR